MERHSPLTLDQILTQLACVLGHKQTGTFYIATDNNTSCRFAVNAGKLTHCTHRRDQGEAALHSLLDIRGGSCSFSENQTIPFRVEAAIDHQTSLEYLGIQPITPLRVEALPLPVVVQPEKTPPAPTPAKNYFYRGGYTGVEASPVEVAKPVDSPIPQRVNNRFYRGGG